VIVTVRRRGRAAREELIAFVAENNARVARERAGE
jgi:hypothetical protein